MGSVEQVGFREQVEQLEAFIAGQRPVESEHYDDQYFQGEWREGGNSYHIETRRKIEAKNPENIKEVFQPGSVLDVGCGPGALMLFLQELGIEVQGIDFSAAAKQMAPDGVREKIVTAPVTDYVDLGREFDLVICREVLEHLTVLQVRQTVQALARYTSKLLYVTTRYHPNPSSLLDVTTDFETDPTHVTCLNKELLRTLFVLEGMRSRPDLEEKMDWKNFGRVLVLEKV